MVEHKFMFFCVLFVNYVVSNMFVFILLIINLCSFFFFFSSRRRHTRCLSDWSSDVCSSDLAAARHDQEREGARRGPPLLLGRPGLRPREALPVVARLRPPVRRDHARPAREDRKSVV